MIPYSKGGAYPAALPFRIRLPDGRTRTNPASFTPEELADAGFVAADPKPAPGVNQEVTWGDGAWVLRDKTPEELADEASANAQAAQDAGRLECRRRIFEVVDEMAQINLAAAAGAGLLSDAQRAAYISGLGWIQLMRGTWSGLVDAGADLSDDANWPAVPDGAAALVAAF
jgi:hypothetical protein